MKKIIFLITISLFTLTASCGYKIVNQSELQNFDISEITATGDKKINYKLKNRLLFKSKKNVNQLITIKLDTIKSKIVKEKNIKNEITKYQITIEVTVSFNSVNANTSDQFVLTKNGDYAVAKKYSQTLNNEKKLIELLSNNLASEILDELILRVNDI